MQIDNRSLPPDSPSPAPPGAGGGVGGVGERAEGGQGGQLVVRELWFIVVMTGVALLLLAIILSVMLHKVRDSHFVLYSMSRRGRADTTAPLSAQCRPVNSVRLS